jgi:hypothetical protein
MVRSSVLRGVAVVCLWGVLGLGCQPTNPPPITPNPGAVDVGGASGSAPSADAGGASAVVEGPADAGAGSPKEPRRCMKERGCPTFAVLPKCEPGLQTKPLAEVLENRNQLLGQKLAVRGPLHQSAGCTEKGCPDDYPCCNHCQGEISLGKVSSTYTYLSLKNSDAAVAETFKCGGDDTLVCCQYPADGEEVVVTGTLVSGFGLDGAQLCAP